MPFKRLTDYTGITIWVATLVFTLGILYQQQRVNTEAIQESKEYEQKVDKIELQIVSLQMQDVYQEQWKSEFMITFKELVIEMKRNNKAILSRMQSTDNNVLKTSYQLDLINNKLKISTVSKDKEP